MGFQIETDRLILRDYRSGDTPLYKKMSSDPKFQRFYSEEDCSEERWQQLVMAFIAESRKSPRTRYNLVITLKNSDELLGATGIRIEAETQASIGCSLRREFHRSGIALEAMKAVARFGFEQLNLEYLFAETISENKPAILLCRKLGMHKETELIGNKFFKGRWWNTLIMGMEAAEWQNRIQSS